MEAGSPLDRAFLIIMLGLALAILSKRKITWSSRIRENLWPILLVAFMFISISWSSIPFISLKRWSRELIALIMAFVVSSERDPGRAIISILRRSSYILLPVSLLLIKYFPKYGVEYGRWSGETMWIGASLQKNSLGSLCVVFAVFLIWTLFRRWRGADVPVAKYQTLVDISLLGLAILLLMGPNRTLNYSATSTIALAAALLALFGLYLLKKRGLGIGKNVLKALVLAIVVYGTITPFLGKLSVLDISSTLGRDGTLTGRAEIWATLVPMAMKRPLLGHGIGGFWTTEIRNLTSAHAHNGYLDAVLDLGIAGILLIAAYLLSCCQIANRTMSFDFDWGVLFVCYLLIIALHNIAESTVNSLTSSLSIIVLFFSASSARMSDERGARGQTPQKVDSLS